MGKNFPSELSRAKNGKGSEGDSCSSTPECFSNALFKGREPQPRGMRGGRTRPDKGERKRVKGERERVLGFIRVHDIWKSSMRMELLVEPSTLS